MGFFGPPNIEKMRKRGDVNGLIQALFYKKDSDDWKLAALRREAVEALGQIGDARAVEPLTIALKDKDREMRWKAVGALGRIGDACTVVPLISALSDSDPYVRKQAVGALVRIGKPAINPLVDRLKQQEWWDCDSIVVALEQLRWAPYNDETGALFWIAKGEYGKCSAIGEPAVKPLIALIKHSLKITRGDAIYALSQIGPRLKTTALHALVVERLIAELKDEERYVRLQATKALKQINDERAVAPLTSMLKDSDSDIRNLAVEALDQMGWTPGQDETGVRYWIAREDIEKCVEIGRAAIEPLITALHDNEQRVCIAAARALVRLYHSGRMDHQIQKRILEQRSVIQYHNDFEKSDGCGGTTHTDTGINQDFSL